MIKFSTKFFDTLIMKLVYEKNNSACEYYYEFDENISTYTFICCHIPNLKNEYIIEHQTIYKQFKDGLSYIYAKRKYEERISFFIIKNKICNDRKSKHGHT